MKINNLSSLIACHECDLLHKKHIVMEGQFAVCQRCGAMLYSNKRNAINRGLALNLASLILFIIALSMPFLGIQAKGIESQISLLNSVTALYKEDMLILSVIVGFVLITVPSMRILGMLFLLIPLKVNKKPLRSLWTYRVVEWIAPWNMVEVYLIGILVTFVKLGETAKIVLGVSFWAFIALVICLVAVNASIDRHSLWDRLEQSW